MSSSLRPGNLPAALSPLIGREREVGAMSAILHRPETRLLTLTGPGGVGKTRLALAAAAESLDAFPDGAWFVGLAAITDPELVASAVANALDMRAAGDQPLAGRLRAHLRDKRLLLVLDNFEQVLPAAPFVIDLLTACSGLTVLVTSRSRLRVSGEQEYAVAPLQVTPLEQPVASEEVPVPDAMRLFVTRAQAVQGDFTLSAENAAAVAEICARLDGLPLAIELAAAWVKMLSPQALLARLEPRLPLLTGGNRDLPARQRTMRDTIAWSYDLLPPEEQAFFRRLAVFVGGFTLAAAEAVCLDVGWSRTPTVRPAPSGPSVLEGIAALVDSSLLRQAVMPHGAAAPAVPRYAMLETVREFGLDRLDAYGETEPACAAHAAYFLSYAEAHTPGPLASVDAAWLDLLDADHDNLRAAFEWLSQQRLAEECLRLVVACAPYWGLREHRRLGRARLDRALALAGPEPTVLRGHALHFACEAALFIGDIEAATFLAREELAVATAVGDPRERALALQTAGWVEEIAGRFNIAAELYRAALLAWQEVGGPVDIARTMVGLVGPTFGLGNLAEARALTEEAAAIFRDAGQRDWLATTEWYLGVIATSDGRLGESAGHFADALRGAIEVDDAHLQAQVLVALAAIAVEAGRAEVAAGLMGAADARLEFGGGELFPFAHQALARAEDGLRAALGDTQVAARAAGRALGQDQWCAAADAVVVAAAEAERARRRRGAGLTAREREILLLLANDKTDREIAEALFLSRRTVNAHVASIRGQLGVHSRKDAVDRARALGLLPAPTEPPRYT